MPRHVKNVRLHKHKLLLFRNFNEQKFILFNLKIQEFSVNRLKKS
jgi:hypothetical protein